jgi:hypothetical protein
MMIAPGLIDSPTKLRVTLLFCQHLQLRASAAHIGQRLPGNPWALEEALDALAEAGVLERTKGPGHWEYALSAHQETRAHLMKLASSFDDPHRREEIYAMVRVVEQERRFRDFLADRRRPHSGAEAYEPLVI